MNYAVRTEKEIAEMDLLPEGDYGFEVLAATEGQSKCSGKDMTTLDLLVFGEDDSQRKVRDYLIPGTNYGDKKLFVFCRGIGLMDHYNNQTLTADLMVGRTGWAKIGVEKGKPKPDGSGNFYDKNTVKWYLKGKPTATVHTMMNVPVEKVVEPGPADKLADEDVPF